MANLSTTIPSSEDFHVLIVGAGKIKFVKKVLANKDRNNGTSHCPGPTKGGLVLCPVSVILQNTRLA
jgi:hypothetical protein